LPHEPIQRCPASRARGLGVGKLPDGCGNNQGAVSWLTCCNSPHLDCYHNHPVTLPRPDPSPLWWGVAGWAHEASPRGPGSNREGSPSVNLGRRSALPLRIFHNLLGLLAIPLKPPTSLGIVGARIDGRIFHRPPLSTPRPLSTLMLPRGQPPNFYGEFAPSISASMVQGIPSLCT